MRRLSLAAFSVAVFAACAPDWDALDPELYGGQGGGGGFGAMSIATSTASATSGSAGSICGGDDGNDCTIDKCILGSSVHQPASQGKPCNTDGGRVCNAKGACVECNADGDCSISTELCLDGACIAVCAGAPSGKVLVQQAKGDCQERRCDGAGNIVSVADSKDVPTSKGECWDGACVDGEPADVPKAKGIPCHGNRTCDGAGSCVK